MRKCQRTGARGLNDYLVFSFLFFRSLTNFSKVMTATSAVSMVTITFPTASKAFNILNDEPNTGMNRFLKMVCTSLMIKSGVVLHPQTCYLIIVIRGFERGTP